MALDDGQYSLQHFGCMAGMILTCCLVAYVLSMTIERPYMKVGRDVIGKFAGTKTQYALLAFAGVSVVTLYAVLLTLGSPGMPLAPPVPKTTF